MLNRFLEAQDNGVYEQALSEIKAGRKNSHWMWFIFPQLTGLGHSYIARYYAIINKDMAAQYLKHPLLGMRLREISQAVYDLQAKDVADVFGYPDYLKFQSCMTLFNIIAPSETIFKNNLQRYFGGQLCRHTELHL